jgi:hypothetical protein
MATRRRNKYMKMTHHVGAGLAPAQDSARMPSTARAEVKMKRFAYGIIVGLMFFLSASTHAEVIGKTDEEVQLIAEPVLNTILAGMKTEDYAMYSKDFDGTMKEALTEEAFLAANKQILESMGEYKSRKYLGFLNQGEMTVVLWKGSFEKTENDFLIKLVVSKQEGKHVVTGLWFQ